MAAGLTAQLSKTSVDNTVGITAQKLNETFRDIASTKAFLDGYEDAVLIELGYTPQDVANMKTAYNDLDALRQVYEGLTASAVKDYRAFASRIWGVGIVV
jgi:predicted trehalose synthase